MTNLEKRVAQLEDKLGMKQERSILVIRCADPDLEEEGLDDLPGEKIGPNCFAFVWGGALTSDELAELRAKYASQQ